MVRYKNNMGAGTIGAGVFGEIEIVVSLLNTYLLYIYVSSDVTDTFTYEFSFC